MTIADDYRALETVVQVLSTSPKECLYCLINEKDKRIQVYSTSNFLSHLSKLVQELGSLNNKELLIDLKNNKARLLILETEFPNKLSRNNKFRQVVQKYKNLDFGFYNELSVVQYRLREIFRYRNNKAYYVIELVGSKGTEPVVVGVFTKWREARGFQDKYYPSGCITEVVIADNDETRTW